MRPETTVCQPYGRTAEAVARICSRWRPSANLWKIWSIQGRTNVPGGKRSGFFSPGDVALFQKGFAFLEGRLVIAFLMLELSGKGRVGGEGDHLIQPA